MRNNLAEILDIHINPDLLYIEWTKQIAYAQDYQWQERNYVELDFFIELFLVVEGVAKPLVCRFIIPPLFRGVLLLLLLSALLLFLLKSLSNNGRNRTQTCTLVAFPSLSFLALLLLLDL